MKLTRLRVGFYISLDGRVTVEQFGLRRAWTVTIDGLRLATEFATKRDAKTAADRQVRDESESTSRDSDS